MAMTAFDIIDTPFKISLTKTNLEFLLVDRLTNQKSSLNRHKPRTFQTCKQTPLVSNRLKPKPRYQLAP